MSILINRLHKNKKDKNLKVLTEYGYYGDIGWKKWEINPLISITPESIIYFDCENGNLIIFYPTNIFYNSVEDGKISVGLYSEDENERPFELLHSIDVNVKKGGNNIDIEIDRYKYKKAKYYGIMFKSKGA